MRQALAGWRMLGCLLAWCLFLGGLAGRGARHPPIVIATTAHHEVEKFDLADASSVPIFLRRLWPTN